jgi:hypothetical protein
MNPTMGWSNSHPAATSVVSTPFTSVEAQALRALRDRFQRSRDQFAGRELARLRFLRWLYETGRVES